MLCEKPLGLDAAEVAAMQQVASQHNRILMEAFMYRYTDRMRVVKKCWTAELVNCGILMPPSASCWIVPIPLRCKAELGGGALCMMWDAIRSTFSGWSPGVSRNVARC